MNEDRLDKRSIEEIEDRAFDPRSLEQRKRDRLGWAQVIASGIDAVARLADAGSRLIR
jgi:hypothetical protein